MLVNDAFAQTAASPGFEQQLMGFLPIILMFVVLYFLMIRPQMKRNKEHRQMLEALKKGGSEGSAFVPGDLKKSLMHVRVTLDPSDEEFMPTEGNPLTKEQVQAFALFI